MPTETPSELKLTLVRHGQTTWNDAGTVQGQRDDARLTALGRDQAQEAAHSLRGETFDSLFSSDLTRAIETAEIIAVALGLEVVTSDALRERNFGDAEGQSVAELDQQLTGITAHRIDNPHAHPRGGESMADVYQRTSEFITRLARERNGQRLLLVTHGGAIRTIRAFASATPLEGLAWDTVENCSVWPVDVSVI